MPFFYLLFIQRSVILLQMKTLTLISSVWCLLYFLVSISSVWCPLYFLVSISSVWCPLYFLVSISSVWCPLYFLVSSWKIKLQRQETKNILAFNCYNNKVETVLVNNSNNINKMNNPLSTQIDENEKDHEMISWWKSNSRHGIWIKISQSLHGK